MMGVLPLTYIEGVDAQHLGLEGTETFDIAIDDNLQPRQLVRVSVTGSDGSMKEFQAIARVDTPIEIEYLRNGGILHYVLRRMAAA
jgi:aconitate hydratase